MFAKGSALFAVLTFALHAAAQNNNTPPACMIAAVNTQKDPSKVKSICQAQEVTDYINKSCGDDRDAAMTYFAGVCKNVNVKISTSTTNSSSTGTESNAASETSGTSTSSGSPTSSNGGSGAASPSATARGTAPIARLGMDVVGLAALGVFGAMLAL